MERAFSVDDIVGTFWKQDVSNDTAPALASHASPDASRFVREGSFPQLTTFSQRMSRSSSEWAFQEFLREHAVGIPSNPSVATLNRLDDTAVDGTDASPSNPAKSNANLNSASQSGSAPSSGLAQKSASPANELPQTIPLFSDASPDGTNVNPEYTALLQHRLAIACAMASTRVGGSPAGVPLSKLGGPYPPAFWPPSPELADLKPGTLPISTPNPSPQLVGSSFSTFQAPQAAAPHGGPSLIGKTASVASPLTPLAPLPPLAPSTPIGPPPDTPGAPMTPLTPGTPSTPVPPPPVGIPALPPKPSQPSHSSHLPISSRDVSDDEEPRSEGEDELVASLEHLTDPDDIKRVKRMLSNRESARRSRRRKQAHLNELETQVAQLQKENSNLANKLNEIGRKYNEAAVDNRVLKSDVEALRAKVQMAEEMLGRASHMPQYMYGIPPFRSVDNGLPLTSHEMPYYPRACRPGQVSTALTEFTSGSSYRNGGGIVPSRGSMVQPSNASQSENVSSGVKMERTPSMQRVASLEHLQKRIRGNRGSLWPSSWEMEDPEGPEHSSDDEEQANET